MVDVLSFEEALAAASDTRNLLLGNGFSMAWSWEAFSYGTLRKKADFSEMVCDPDELFDALDTSDFEVAIERLHATDLIARLYDPDSEIAADAAADAEIVRDALANALAANHPDNVGAIPDEQYASVRAFLSHFSCVYTLNYDLLLYWACLHEDEVAGVPSGDGFRADPDDLNADWVTWDMAHSYTQELHYLHGALHLFDAGDRLKKLTWTRTAVPLIDQIRGQLDERSYPLVVTEGSSEDKLEKIMHSAYLSRGMRSFSATGKDLFVYGHSLADNDEHVLRAIVNGKIERLFVSLYGDPTTPENQAVIARAEALSERRRVREEERRRPRQLRVTFFDAASASVWDSEA